MAKQGISPVNLAGAMFKIVLIAIFFSVDISYGDQRLPILEHNRGFSQKIHLFASTSGRDGGFAGVNSKGVTGDC
ncbi:MAG: hypothetical protein SBU_001370 [Candidatus Syntrophoarchaeum butanivorans]|uniref:Uncharacterized protein n=1 Tax=Candidatus Syntropharchaeum butanivorans TaxID=1839936 RepID=A0A1F2P337_9EURY|nr:MAG: hypothetical protein SBU_001370 [Candidatus Syntrophoarchaeum butanivorans]